MKNRRHPALVTVTGILCLAAAWPLHADSASPTAAVTPAAATATAPATVPKANAADLYRQAFDLLTDELRGIGDMGPADQPVPENLLLLLDDNQDLIGLVRKAALTPGCDWGTHIEDGPAVTLPYLGNMRTLARLMLLQLRSDTAVRNGDAVAADLQTLDGLARHTGTDKLLICLLVKRAIQGMVIRDAALLLPTLPEPALAGLEQAFAEPRPGETRELADAMRSEKQMTAWLRRRIQMADGSPDKAGEVWKELNAMSGNDLHTSIMTRDTGKLLAWCDEVDAFQDEMIRICNLPDSEAATAAKAVQEQVESRQANPLLRMLAPAVTPACQKEAAFTLRAALLRAAVGGERARRAGQAVEDAVAATHDPSGNGPFHYQPQPSGKTYLLSATLAEKSGKPVTLEVGTDAFGK